MSTDYKHPTLIFKEISNVLEYVIKGTEAITKHFNGTAMDKHIRTFCLFMLDRLNFSCEGLKTLLPAYLENTKLEYSCGIIIRSVMLDYLIILNAVNIVSEADSSANTTDLHSELEEFA